MNKRLVLISAIGLCILGCSSSEKDEVSLTLEQVPAAVRATINKEAAGSQITEIERELEDGKTVYTAEISKDGKEEELTIAPDGRLISRELEDD